MCHQRPCQFDLRPRRQRRLADFVEKDQGVVLAAETVLDQVAGDQRNLLLLALLLRMVGKTSGSRRRNPQSGGFGSAATSARMSGFSTGVIVGAAPSSFLILCSAVPAGGSRRPQRRR